MKRLIALCLASFALVGCHATAQSTDYTTYFLDKDYQNRPVNDFFQTYGYSEGMFDLSNGYRMYRWTSIQPPAIPNKSIGDGYTILDTYQGKVERQYCELRIYTDKQDIVRSIVIAVDSVGRMGGSRCSEIFSKS